MSNERLLNCLVVILCLLIQAPGFSAQVIVTMPQGLSGEARAIYKVADVQARLKDTKTPYAPKMSLPIQLNPGENIIDVPDTDGYFVLETVDVWPGPRENSSDRRDVSIPFRIKFSNDEDVNQALIKCKTLLVPQGYFRQASLPQNFTGCDVASVILKPRGAVVTVHHDSIGVEASQYTSYSFNNEKPILRVYDLFNLNFPVLVVESDVEVNNLRLPKGAYPGLVFDSTSGKKFEGQLPGGSPRDFTVMFGPYSFSVQIGMTRNGRGKFETAPCRKIVVNR